MTYAGYHNLLNYPACQAHMHCENTTVNMKLKINLQIFKSLYFLILFERKHLYKLKIHKNPVKSSYLSIGNRATIASKLDLS